MSEPGSIQADLNRLTGEHARLVRAARLVGEGLCNEAPNVDADDEYIELWAECWVSQGTFLRSRLLSLAATRRTLTERLEQARRPIYGPPMPTNASFVLAPSDPQPER